MQTSAPDLFATRASVRHYAPTPVAPEAIDRLLEAAVQAPSAGNCQPWHFYVVQRPAMKERLYAHAYHQHFLRSAPVLIVVCAEMALSAQRYAQRGKTLYCLQDTAAAIENILLCAAQQGLGSCWCGAFDEGAVSRAMVLPKDRRPVAILAIGHPEGAEEKPERRPMHEVVTYLT